MKARFQNAFRWMLALVPRFFPRLAFFSIVTTAAMWPALSIANTLNEARDAQMLQSLEQHAVDILLRYGQLPLWDPYSYGGLYVFGTAQTRFAAPTVLLSLALGPYRAVVVTAYLLMLAGMEGAYRYLRLRAGSSWGCVLAAPLFVLSGYLAHAYYWGWLWFFGALLLPWALYGTARAARGEPTGAALVAVVFAFLLGFGAAYVIPMTALFCVIEVARCGVERRLRAPWWPAATALFCAVALAAGLSAYRLWPMLDFMAAAPRIMAGSPGNSLQDLGQMLFSPAEDVAKHRVGMAYVGTAGALLVLVGALRRRGWAALAILLIAVWTATGYAWRTSPFVWLRELPVFSTLRYPERYLPFAFLFALELLAIGANAVTAFALRRAKWLVVLPVTLVALNASQLVGNLQHVIREIWHGPVPERVERPFRQSRGNRWVMAHYGALQLGSLGCADGTPLPQSERVRGDLREEHYLLEPSAGRIEAAEWTPERLDFRVSLTQPTTLIVNQNYHPGWRASLGAVRSVDGLLAVDLPAGASALSLRFLPCSAVSGAASTLVAIVALVFVWTRLRSGSRWKSRKAAMLACVLACAPLPVAAATAIALREPSRPAPVYRNANGTEVVLDDLPPTAAKLTAEFDAPVQIVGVSIPETARVDDEVGMEVFFRVNGPVPRSVGVFVHVEGPKRMGADHEVIGSSMFLRDAPRGKILRDAFAIHAPREAGRYRVYLGLWNTSGDGRRVGVHTADWRARIADDRIEIGSFELVE